MNVLDFLGLCAGCGLMAQTLREERGLSQADVARLSGLSNATVSRFEFGQNVTLETVSKIAQAFDMETGEFITEASSIERYTRKA